ncbi:MAG: hypothetical protein HOQ24_12470, partial [Mycobacteriaceae bacterium]|nr:hypothetical protein [Mycobacteriaceae bacterium]
HFATQDTGPGYVRDTTPGPTDNTPSQPTNTDQPSNPPTDTTPNQPTNPDQPSQPSAPEQSQAPTDMNQLQQQLDRMDPLTNGNPPPSPLGTSPYSSTQMAMMGSMMAGGFFSLGMTPGSMGSMAGAATGFRMPANWSNGTAYGASNAPANAPVRAPIRKVSAAKKQMRKRREENSESKVYVPGEPQEVPVLEQPPVIGVLDASDDHEDTPVLESALPVGVLEYVDDDEREDTAKSVPTR